VKRDWLALAFAMVFPSVMSWVYFVALAGGGQGNTAVQLAYGAGKAVQFGFPFLYVWWFARQDIRIRPPPARGLGLALAFGLLVGAGMLALYHFWLKHTPLFEQAPGQIYEKLQEFNLATPAGFFALAIFIAVAHSLFEEYYFRWFIFGRLARHVALPRAIAISSLAFMAHHVIVLAVYFPGPLRFVTVVLPFSLAVAVGGAVWAWMYHRSGSLYAPWLSHLVIDVAVMLVGWDMVAPLLGAR
jgi:hypothetical protein